MANEELTGALGGFSSGLTESIGQRLQAEGLNIRSQRTATLNRELDFAEQLRLDKLPEQQAELEHEQKMRKAAFELKQTELADAQRAEAEKNELKTPIEYLNEEMDPTPDQEGAFNQIANTFMREFMDADGKISRLDYKEFQKNVREGNVPGYLESYKNMLSVGIKQADNLKEAKKIEVRKAEEKDPALTNPEYRKLIPKVAEADAAIAQLEEASNNYSVERRAVEEHEKKLEERKKKEAEQKKLNQERIAMIETIQRARKGKVNLTGLAKNEFLAEKIPEFRAALDRAQQSKLEVAEAMSGIKAKAQGEQAKEELSRKAKPIQQAVSELRQMVDTVFTAEGLISRALFAAEGKIADTAQFNETQENIILFNTLSEALVPPLARFLTNEKGPLTESDKAPARALMPKIGDGKPVAQKKMDLVERLLEAAAGGKAGKPASKKTFDIGNRNIKDMSIEELVDLRQGK